MKKVFIFLLIFGFLGSLGYLIKIKRTQKSGKKTHQRVFFVPENSTHFGIDVSHHNGIINWDKVGKIDNKHEIEFVYIKATEGENWLDKRFIHNWKGVKKRNLKRGAYHFYNPNKNSTKQAAFFIKNVPIDSTDLPPVVDIEHLPKKQSITNLCIGLKNYLQLIEAHYGKKPIVYTGAHFYNHIKDSLVGYPLWVANYNRHPSPLAHDWELWQFSESGSVVGINGYCDINTIHANALELYCRKPQIELHGQ